MKKGCQGKVMRAKISVVFTEKRPQKFFTVPSALSEKELVRREYNNFFLVRKACSPSMVLVCFYLSGEEATNT